MVQKPLLSRGQIDDAAKRDKALFLHLIGNLEAYTWPLMHVGGSLAL